MKWKSLVSWMKKSNSGRDNKETNKIMAMEELLEKNRQGEHWAHWHQRRNKALETLTYDFQSWRLPSKRKTFENFKSQLSQVKMFLCAFFFGLDYQNDVIWTKGFLLCFINLSCGHLNWRLGQCTRFICNN